MQPTKKHMDLFKRRHLERLMQPQQSPCISIYMPTERRGSEVEQNPIRYKNLITEVENQLEVQGMRKVEMQELLAPLYDFRQNSQTQVMDFWQHQSDGLALFLSPDMFRYYRLPYPFEEEVHVGDQFYVRPLIPLLSGDNRFYLLALNLGEVKLYQGTRYQIGEIDLEDTPESLAEALRYDEFEKQQQSHVSESSPSGQNAMWHGHGTGSDAEQKELIKRFFTQLDNGVTDFLNDDPAPLILAGLPHLQGIYREVNHYPHLIKEGIDLNPQEMSADKLHGPAWHIIEQYFNAERREAEAAFQQLAGTGDERGTNEIEDIVSAACFQRVDTLFLQRDAHVWGRFDEAENAVTQQEEESADSQDLLDLAAQHTLLNGGTVYTYKLEDMPGGTPAAAILRF